MFQINIARLQREWRNSFGDEKKRLFWDKLQGFTDEFMIDATNEFIANRRAAPVLSDFLEYVDEYYKRKRTAEEREALTMAGFLDAKYDPANYDDTETRARIKGRLELVKQFAAKRITKRQFDQGCDFYDKAAGLDPKEIVSGMNNHGEDYVAWVHE